MTATLVSTLAAVSALLDPLVTATTLAANYNGQQERLDLFPCAETLFGAGTVTRDQQGRILERQQARTGVVRLSVQRLTDMPREYAKLAPLIDAVEAIFKANPHLIGLDRFDANGNGIPAMDDVGEKKTVYVDVGWYAIEAEVDTIVQDW